MKRALASFVALAGLTVAGSAAASPEDLFGYGARTSGMGATGTAYASGAEAAWHNPALASLNRKNELTLGVGEATYQLKRADVDAARGVVVGLALPIPFAAELKNRVGMSFALYTPSNLVVRARTLYPEQPQYPILADRSQSVTLRWGIGANIGWGIRVGVGVAALAELSGKVVAQAGDTSVDEKLVATYAPDVGVSWERGHYRVGAIFRGKLDARFDVTVDGSKVTTLQIPVFDISGLAQYDPAQVAIEAARVEAENDRVFALQLVYKRWSNYPGLLTPTVLCSDGTTSCGLQPAKVAWKDTVAVRAGIEQGTPIAHGIRLVTRAGGFVETSPLPSTLPSSPAYDPTTQKVVNVPTRYYDGTRIAITAGAGLSSARFAWDFFVQEQFVLKNGNINVLGMTGTVRF